MRTTRRQTLKSSLVGSLLALGIAPRSAAQQGRATEIAKRLATRLARQRASIRTFRAHLESHDTRNPRVLPQTDLYYQRAKYHLRHSCPEGWVTEISAGDTHLQVGFSWTGAATTGITQPHGSPETPKHINLSTIMPVCANRIVFDQGRDRIGTHNCRKLLQRDTVYWVDEATPLVRMLQVYWKGWFPNEVVRYRSFERYERVYVPRRVEVDHIAPDGRHVGRRLIELSDVEINGEVDPSLFDMSPYRYLIDTPGY